MRVLLLGSGGREHALAWKLAQSPRLGWLLSAPGNPGMAALGMVEPGLDILDPEAVARFARDRGVDLVVVGPEAPLVAGVADAVLAAGIPVFGPSAAAARLEASKAFTKALCDEAGIPTAAWARFDALAPALAHVRRCGAPIVVKADGLAAGKGVTVAATLAEAEAALEALFASPGAGVVIEECLAGEEVSFFVLAHGTDAVPLLAAQDHKRLGEGDTGPNTGGMGAYAPAAVFTPALAAETMERIIRPTLATMAARGTPFSGVLFAGLMLTAEGPKLVEYNVRFGDPECQALMLLLESDLLSLLHATATGHLAGAEVLWKPGKAIAVVVAARGYPGAPAAGGEISGLEGCGATVFHAGTRRERGRLVAAGGRVLTVGTHAPTLAQAAQQAYAAIERISFADACFRRDIGWRELAREAGGRSA
ncbi:MAG: phosphoribosylamine--glycine ligase [Thermaurantiacus tibetensis]|uniref:phosphoribosylamine--glycine ligase n=1 Tax=Thermaurantiacus tibetensis TaxID=2759035 RepID=UPI001A9C9375|nr:phosphoribosylamine--glycine ligase [Thermaurantiacus tibetensis]